MDCHLEYVLTVFAVHAFSDWNTGINKIGNAMEDRMSGTRAVVCPTLIQLQSATPRKCRLSYELFTIALSVLSTPWIMTRLTSTAG